MAELKTKEGLIVGLIERPTNPSKSEQKLEPKKQETTVNRKTTRRK